MAMNGTELIRQWRLAHERSDYMRELQSENLIAGTNTREINLSSKGKFIIALKLFFQGTLNAVAAEAPLAGVTALDVFMNNLKVRGPGKSEVQNLVSSQIAAAVHRRFLDEEFAQTALPVFAAPGAQVITADLTVPVVLPLSEGYYTLVFDADRVITGYAADVTLDNPTMRVDIRGGDYAPRRNFAIESQTLNLAPAGFQNVTTNPQGWPIVYTEFVNFNDGLPAVANPSDLVVDTIEWNLPTSDTIIAIDAPALQSTHDQKVDYVRPVGTWGMDTAAVDAAGREVSWTDGGVFKIQTVVGAGAIKTPDMWQLLLREVVRQPRERPISAGAAPNVGNRRIRRRQRTFARRRRARG